MHLERLLLNICDEFKLRPYTQDQNNLFYLTINPRNQIVLSELHPGIYLSCPIMPLPELGNKEALFIYLMKANLLGQGTGGSAIGIDAKEKFLTLSLTLPYEVNYKIFRERIEDFMNYLDFWREEVPRFQERLLE